mgnify:CR=1 FL=1
MLHILHPNGYYILHYYGYCIHLKNIQGKNYYIQYLCTNHCDHCILNIPNQHDYHILYLHDSNMLHIPHPNGYYNPNHCGYYIHLKNIQGKNYYIQYLYTNHCDHCILHNHYLNDYYTHYLDDHYTKNLRMYQHGYHIHSMNNYYNHYLNDHYIHYFGDYYTKNHHMYQHGYHIHSMNNYYIHY